MYINKFKCRKFVIAIILHLLYKRHDRLCGGYHGGKTRRCYYKMVTKDIQDNETC